MIIAITDERGGMEKSILAGRLAASRALAGRKVLLLDADPRQGAMAQARNLHDGAMHGSLTRPRLMARAISAKGLQPELEHLCTATTTSSSTAKAAIPWAAVRP